MVMIFCSETGEALTGDIAPSTRPIATGEAPPPRRYTSANNKTDSLFAIPQIYNDFVQLKALKVIKVKRLSTVNLCFLKAATPLIVQSLIYMFNHDFQPNQCSTAKSRKQFRNINRPWGVAVSKEGWRPNQRYVSSDYS